MGAGTTTLSRTLQEARFPAPLRSTRAATPPRGRARRHRLLGRDRQASIMSVLVEDVLPAGMTRRVPSLLRRTPHLAMGEGHARNRRSRVDDPCVRREGAPAPRHRLGTLRGRSWQESYAEPSSSNGRARPALGAQFVSAAAALHRCEDKPRDARQKGARRGVDQSPGSETLDPPAVAASHSLRAPSTPPTNERAESTTGPLLLRLTADEDAEAIWVAPVGAPGLRGRAGIQGHPPRERRST